jgi:hypothetical protein
LFLVHRFLSPWWRRRQVPPKRRFLQEPHGVTTQKTPFFIVTAVKTSNLTSPCIFVAQSPICPAAVSKGFWRWCAVLRCTEFLDCVRLGPAQWSSRQRSWLRIQISWFRFPALPDFMRRRGSGTGSTQPHEDNCGATWNQSSGSGLENWD